MWQRISPQHSATYSKSLQHAATHYIYDAGRHQTPASVPHVHTHPLTHIHTYTINHLHKHPHKQTLAYTNMSQLTCTHDAASQYSQQYMETHCHALQHTATYCSAHVPPAMPAKCGSVSDNQTYNNSLQLTATHCNSLQLIAIHCNTLQHTEPKMQPAHPMTT